MIGDYKGGDEAVLAAALEVFDLLSNTLAEYETAVSPRAAGSNPTPPRTGHFLPIHDSHTFPLSCTSGLAHRHRANPD